MELWGTTLYGSWIMGESWWRSKSDMFANNIIIDFVVLFQTWKIENIWKWNMRIIRLETLVHVFPIMRANPATGIPSNQFPEKNKTTLSPQLKCFCAYGHATGALSHHFLWNIRFISWYQLFMFSWMIYSQKSRISVFMFWIETHFSLVWSFVEKIPIMGWKTIPHKHS